MTIAIATSDEVKSWYSDMDLLIAAAHDLGAKADIVVWDDPTIQWPSYNTVLIDSVWDYTEKYEQFMEWCTNIASTCKLVNPLDVIKISSNKRYLLTLASKGLPIAQSYILEKSQNLDVAKLKAFDKKIVIKPLIGAGGVDTILFENITVAAESKDFDILHGRCDLLIQEFVPEIKTAGEISALFIDGQLSHCVLKTTSKDDFRIHRQYGGSRKPVNPPAYVLDLYQQTISALGIKPIYARLDFVPTKIPTIMEVEMVEPHKYFSLFPQGANLLASALVR